jgi:hypothetical protein
MQMGVSFDSWTIGVQVQSNSRSAQSPERLDIEIPLQRAASLIHEGGSLLWKRCPDGSTRPVLSPLASLGTNAVEGLTTTACRLP